MILPANQPRAESGAAEARDWNQHQAQTTVGKPDAAIKALLFRRNY
jgi:hypothetical protein